MIVIGYPGVGKTTLCGRKKGTIDLESIFFHGSAKEKNWEQLYCEVALDLSRQGYIVFVSSHHEVCEKIICLRNPDIDEVVAVYPESNERMKTQWIQRLRNRVDMDQQISYGKGSNIGAALDEKDKHALKRAEDHYFVDTSAMSKLPFCRIELSTMQYDLLKEIAEVQKSRCDPATIHKVIPVERDS
jgi:broad-specificity NMP kinase